MTVPVISPEDSRIAQLAMGRIFLLGSRPEQPGDIEQYETCRAIILNVLGGSFASLDRFDPTPNYARDRLRGAAGDY